MYFVCARNLSDKNYCKIDYSNKSSDKQWIFKKIEKKKIINKNLKN